jgi:hypothetical protein
MDPARRGLGIVRIPPRRWSREVADMNKQELEARVATLEKELRDKDKSFRECLQHLNDSVRLLGNWANGPAFRKAGVIWPNNTCNAPAYVKALHWLKIYYQGHD